MGHTYVITKCFLRSPSATLTEDGREIARSKQADEAVSWNFWASNPVAVEHLMMARLVSFG